ncbi:MAG: UPF0182 family protein, partial [Deltaproteobacteria bacterium]|nr:UPF0182 family protein [Deltaproteobacteria bacterium]
LVTGCVWVGLVLLFGSLLPGLVQNFIVRPNELSKESPYIAYNIQYTRKAYNLDRIREVPFEVSDVLQAEDLRRHGPTIQNIRIWDERPLHQTYRQIQSIRLYYDFQGVDVDRYLINGQYRQVMLAARELVVGQLPVQANTWVNRHLIYTHGYGLASSPVNEVTREGLPQLWIKDLPPRADASLEIDRPEIYYGERTDEYVLVKTKTEEFDFPKGDKNVYTLYKGKGGVPIGSFWRRLLYAMEFLDPQILFTNYLTRESRIMYNRTLARRTHVLAPFLDYDRDPYLVVSGGRLYWVLDAYTTSNLYPYAQRIRTHFRNTGVNYIRNSVKVVIDAYDGEATFYRVDEQDPVLNTYAAIFPGLFRPFDDMPPDLKRHIRYPKDLFQIQVDTYTRYHMEDVQVFYNQEDLWQVPDEIYGDSRQAMEPYYIIIKLPDAEREEFLLMLPFTPSKKDNMIGWLAARSDMPHYGTLVVYKLPKEKLVYGPMQIEARVDQQTEISRELSLWGQRGSRVIRGNLLAIPVGETFIYVEPVYLEAKQEEAEQAPAASPKPRGLFQSPKRNSPGVGQMDRTRAASLPELKRVIASFGDRVVMRESLDEALRAVLSGDAVPGPVTAARRPAEEDVRQLGNLALETFRQAQKYLRDGKWAEYGQELESLEKVLERMAAMEAPEAQGSRP